MSLVVFSYRLNRSGSCLIQPCMMHQRFADRTKVFKGKLQPRRAFGKSSGKKTKRLAP